MEFTDKIADDLLQVNFAAANKEEALRGIAKIAAGSPVLREIGAETVYQKLLEREQAVSTGIGGGMAIPHARIECLTDFLVFVLVAPKGVDFAALDRKKVRLFFVVFAPEHKVNDHLQLLASISRAMSRPNVKKELINARDKVVLREILVRAAGGEIVNKVTDERKKLLIAVLYYEEDLREVLEFLIDQGIEGATIINSQGMGAYVSSMPLFASFLGFMRQDRNTSNTVMILIPAGQEQWFVEGIEKITGNLEKKQGAMVMTLDVSFHKGTMSMI